MNAQNVLQDVETIQERVAPHLRDGAELFHENEGELFSRGRAVELVSERLDVSESLATDIVSQLVSDTVDPVIQVVDTDGSKRVGVAQFKEFDGAYGYINFDDMFGEGKRVVCQQCVNDATVDTAVTHATENDPNGSFADGASWDELLDAIHAHYESSHTSVPNEVTTGATLASGTTIGTNTAWHAGNDGENSGLEADTLQGKLPSDLGGVTYTQSTEPTNPASGETWYDTSSGVYQVYGDLEGSLAWYSIPPVQTLEESSTFKESDVTATFNDTTTALDRVELFDTRWNLGTVSSINSASVSTGLGDGLVFHPDGTSFLAVGYDAGVIKQYSLSTPWDITTASDTGKTYTPRGVQGLAVGDGGSRVYTFDYDGVYEAVLSTPWDISTASQGYSYKLGGDWANAIAFKPDGTAFFRANGDTDKLFKHSLSTPWDITTETQVDTKTLTEDGTGRRPEAINFSPDGTRVIIMWYVDAYAYSLSTPWDISTISYTGNKYTFEGYGLHIDETGGRAYNLGIGDDSIYSYDLGIVENQGDVLIEWDSGAPTGINSYDLATFRRTLDNETVTIDVEDGNGNVLFSDISQNFDISTIDTSKNVKLRANLSRNDSTNSPTLDYAARRYTQ